MDIKLTTNDDWDLHPFPDFNGFLQEKKGNPTRTTEKGVFRKNGVSQVPGGGPAEIVDHSDNHLWSRSRGCSWDDNFGEVIPERTQISTRSLENALNSLRQTLNEVCIVLNRSLRNGTREHQEGNDINKPFIVDGKTYYHPIPGERTPLRPRHPFEIFETDELPLLSGRRLSEYKDMKVLARGDRALAYFFHKHTKLSTSTKLQIGRIFRAYLKEMKSVSYENILIYMRRLDLGWNRSFNYLDKVLFSLRKLVTFSYNFHGSFPEIKLTTKKKVKGNVSSITPNQIWKAHRLLLTKKDFENALLLRLMFTFALMPYEVRMLKFEDVRELENGK